MSIGSKIKKLRKMQGLTQQELADGIITRGMLSRIESETALPSMQTLESLADRLEIPASFLLNKSDDILPAERSRVIKAMIEEFKNGNTEECLEIFRQSEFEIDFETAGIYTTCAFSRALQCFYAGDFVAAEALLQAASDALPKVLFPLRNVSADHIAFLRTVMQHIDNLNDVIQTVDCPVQYGFAPSLFFFILNLLQNGRHNDARLFAEFGSIDTRYFRYIEAQIMIREYKFVDAILTMKALIAEESCPVFFALLCHASIENCCKLCEDYKGAYENHIRYEELLHSIRR